MTYDPICGKGLSKEPTGPSLEYKRRKYYFCSSSCRSAFVQETERVRIRELAKVGALLSSGKVRWGMA
jgi:YHS domain-containing protein